MRIIAGELKSRQVRAPGSDTTRPTSDKVRGAIFNVLSSLFARRELDWEHFGTVLDLYAGSGALAFEALSRGIPKAILVENDRPAQQAIRENVISLGVLDRVKTVPVSVQKFLASAPVTAEATSRPWLVFADPPYAKTDYDRLLALIDASGSIPPGSLVVVEYSSQNGPGSGGTLTRLEKVSSHAWGDTRATVYEVRPAARENTAP